MTPSKLRLSRKQRLSVCCDVGRSETAGRPRKLRVRRTSLQLLRFWWQRTPSLIGSVRGFSPLEI